MTRLEFKAEIAAPRDKVWAFYDDLSNLPRITPPATRVWVKNPPAVLSEGVRFLLIIRQPPLYLPIRWETVITVYRPPHLFVDEQGACGPFAFWRHEHLLEEIGHEATLLRDSITYIAPLGVAGAVADRVFLRPMLAAMFAYRHRKTREALESDSANPRKSDLQSAR